MPVKSNLLRKSTCVTELPEWTPIVDQHVCPVQIRAVGSKPALYFATERRASSFLIRSFVFPPEFRSAPRLISAKIARQTGFINQKICVLKGKKGTKHNTLLISITSLPSDAGATRTRLNRKLTKR